jgi:hypothetical protein
MQRDYPVCGRPCQPRQRVDKRHEELAWPTAYGLGPRTQTLGVQWTAECAP